eukprot:gene46154-57552_t
MCASAACGWTCASSPARRQPCSVRQRTRRNLKITGSAVKACFHSPLISPQYSAPLPPLARCGPLQKALQPLHPAPMSEQNHAPAPQDENQLIAERREKLRALRDAQAQGGAVAFPNNFKPAHKAAALQAAHSGADAEALEANPVTVSVGGRMMLKRVMGKASFATVQDGSLGDTGGRIQLYITRDAVGEELYAAFKHWDLGDIVGAEGTLMKTKTGELSIKVTSLRLLTKSLRPLPARPDQTMPIDHATWHRLVWPRGLGRK